jgi:aminopeptidase N
MLRVFWGCACVLGCALWACSGSQAHVEDIGSAESDAKPSAWSVSHYEVDLALTSAPTQALLLRGIAAVHVELHATSAIQLDAVGFLIAEVTCSPACTWTYDDPQLHIQWPTPQTTHAEIEVRYHAAPTQGVTVTEQAIWTAFHTWHWMPTTQNPAMRATLHLQVRGPEGWTVIATGDGPDLPGPDDVLAFPYPSYLYGFAMGHFEQQTRIEHNVRLELWTPPGSAGVEVALDRTAAALGRWTNQTGTPWALGRYVQVFVPGKAAQELSGMAFLSAHYLDTLSATPDEDWLIVHELAHQAWGNRVTCATWGDFWINEAVVVWWVARDKQLRGDEAGYLRERALWAERWERGLQKGDDPRIARPGVSVKGAGGTIVYHGGATVIAEIVEAVGVERFEAALTTLIGQANGENGLSISTEAFLSVLGLQAPERAEVLRRLGGVK